MSEGATKDEVVRRLHGQITDHGFAIVPVGRGEKARGWAYTVGLVAGMDHPELVIAGYPLGHAVAILDDLGRLAVAGERLDAGPGSITYWGVTVSAVPVHPWQIRRGLISAWRGYYDSLGRRDLDPRALQIVLPDG
ncbi:MAG TPA: DUF4262 domain-containing protein, partial [Acidimicrobiales bacterium]|nr:DUF4262 domain-containing protein [Acidimicrobiales bacterium]